MNRTAVATISFLVVTIAVPWGVYRAMEAAAVPLPVVALQYVRAVSSVLDDIPPPKLRSARSVVFFGDSMSVAYPPRQTVPDRVQYALAGLGPPPIRIDSVAASGSDPFDFYFVADLVRAVRPDAVVILFNAATLGRTWMNALGKPELVGWVAPSRWATAARLPLHWTGLTWDRILFYQAIVGLGGSELWFHTRLQQARVETAHKLLEQRLLESGLRDAEQAARTERQYARRDAIITPTRNRYTATRARRVVDSLTAGVAADHPIVQVLAATIRFYGQSGVPVLVVVVPINVEHLRNVGALTDDRIDHSVATVGAAIRAAGGDFLDLHGVFGDDAFRDAAGHLACCDRFDGPTEIAQRMAPILRAMTIAATPQM